MGRSGADTAKAPYLFDVPRVSIRGLPPTAPRISGHVTTEAWTSLGTLNVASEARRRYLFLQHPPSHVPHVILHRITISEVSSSVSVALI